MGGQEQATADSVDDTSGPGEFEDKSSVGEAEGQPDTDEDRPQDLATMGDYFEEVSYAKGDERIKSAYAERIKAETEIRKEEIRSNIQLREDSLGETFLLYRWVIIGTLFIIILQGIQFPNQWFDLPDGFIRWLGAATVGEVAGLLIMAFGYLFPIRSSSDPWPELPDHDLLGDKE